MTTFVIAKTVVILTAFVIAKTVVILTVFVISTERSEWRNLFNYLCNK